MDKFQLNDYDVAVITNGCRPKWLTDIIPKKLDKALSPYFNEVFKECCNAHDIDFFIGVSKEKFNESNEQFYKCMKRAIKKYGNWYSRWWFYYKAYQYYKLVSEFGWSSYNSTIILDLEDLPSYQISKDQKINIECVWLHGRWWLRSELGYKD